MNKLTPLILVAEDQDELREQLTDFLVSLDYRVLAAEDGYKAYKLAATNHPDLIISDVAMPIWDGQRLLAELKQNQLTKDIPLLFLSAWANRDHVRKGMQLGAVDYITKPFSLNDITEAVKSQIERNETVKQRIIDARNQIRTELLSLLPHEMLTPLNAILGPAQLLSTADDSMPMAEVRDWGDLISKSAAHLTRMVEKMLIYAELHRGNTIIHEQPSTQATQQNILTDAITTVVNERYKGRSMAIVSGNLGRTKIPDHALKRVLCELLDNAYKFNSATDHVRIDITKTERQTEIRISNPVFKHPNDLGNMLNNLISDEIEKQRSNWTMSLGIPIANGLLKLNGGSLHFNISDNTKFLVSIHLP
jgi:CheY-like chemotaxis protein